MSDTVKLIIEIPSIDYEYLKNNCIIPIKYDNHIYEAILNGTPLDTVKAEIEKLDEGITSYHNDKPWVYKSEVLEILDNIGKGDRHMDLISKEELKDYLEKNISFGGTEKKFRFYDMIDSLPSAFEGMTNGEVFQAIFPCDEVLVNGLQEEIVHFSMKSNLDSMDCFELEWWNSPYQKGREGDK